MDMPQRDDQPPAIDGAAIDTFVRIVFDGLAGHVPIRLLAETGTPDQKPVSRFCPVKDVGATLQRLAPEAARASRGLYSVPGTVARPGRARAADIAETRVVLVDLDSGDIEAKRGHLVEHLGEPSLEVASGGRTEAGVAKLHLYWRLREVARGADLERVRMAREEIAIKVGADTSFASLHQPIRVSGTIHGKNGRASPVHLIAARENAFDLAALAAAIRRMTVLPGIAPEIDTGAPRRKGPSVGELSTRRIRAGNADGVTRFEAVSSVIGHWIRTARRGECSLGEAWAAVRDYNAALIDPPWDEVRLKREFDALLDRDRAAHSWTSGRAGRPGNGAAGEAATAPALSDDALAKAFVDAHGGDWRHVASWGFWYGWTGTHWAADERRQVRELVRQISRSAADGADKPPEARRLASAKTIGAVEQIARTDPAIAIGSDDWDASPMLLNTPAGILDLETGETLPHDPTRHMTQITAASPGTGCPRWRDFLDEITDGDSELQAYLARLCGYCLTGETTEQVLAFLHGHGANGKSVFLQTIAAVMGNYAATATLDTFVQTRGSRHLTELAGLRAARIVIVPETELGASWAEARIKLVTGGEKIRANFMHQNHFEYRPQFKLLVAGNHRPQLSSVGEAMRRRLHVVPFTVTIPAERRDPALARKLIEEGDGILGWMIDGCAEWRRIGLAPPRRVSEAADEYFRAEDLVGQWVDEMCDVGAGHRATSQALYGSWSAWAEAAGEAKGTSKALGEALRARGFHPGRVDRARGWHGIALRRPLTGVEDRE